MTEYNHKAKVKFKFNDIFYIIYNPGKTLIEKYCIYPNKIQELINLQKNYYLRISIETNIQKGSFTTIALLYRKSDIKAVNILDIINNNLKRLIPKIDDTKDETI